MADHAVDVWPFGLVVGIVVGVMVVVVNDDGAVMDAYLVEPIRSSGWGDLVNDAEVVHASEGV